MKTGHNVVEIYTDGACSGNPGPGGWGAIILYPNSDSPRKISGSSHQTTNNQMELMAITEALNDIAEASTITVFTDSTYALNAVSGKSKGTKNRDLIEAARQAKERHNYVEIKWVPAHSGHKWNEEADRLAVAAIKKFNRPQSIIQVVGNSVDSSQIQDIIVYMVCEKLDDKNAIAAFSIKLPTSNKPIYDSKIFMGTQNSAAIELATSVISDFNNYDSISLFSDLTYIVNGATKWIKNWKQADWKRKEIQHMDLWKKWDSVANIRRVNVQFKNMAESQEMKDLKAMIRTQKHSAG